MKRLLIIAFLGLVASLWSVTVFAQSDSGVSVAAGGIFPEGTIFNGVPLTGLQSGCGVQIAATGSTNGDFMTTLIGVGPLGVEQKIVIIGTATGGSRAANIATFSGSATVYMGDGTLPLPGVPFTATVTTDVNDQGTIGLVIGLTTLPNATVNQGSMTIQ